MAERNRVPVRPTPDPDNAGGGHIFLRVRIIQEVFFMDEQTLDSKPNKISSFFSKYGWIIATACGIIAILFLLGTIVKYRVVTFDPDGEEIKTYFDVHLWDYFKGLHSYDWTMAITLSLLVLGVICATLQKIHRTFASAASILFILGLTLIILSREFFASNTIENMDKVEYGWGSALAVSFAIFATVFCVSSDFSNYPIVTREIAEDGILIALAFILNLIKIPLAAGAGSINLQMLPLFIIALRHGPMHGLVCGGIVYGLITCLTDGYGFACYPFDYLIGFGSVVVMGFFKPLILSENQKFYNLKGEIFLLVAGILATLVRLVGSTASSMIVYKYTFAAALAYNAVYIPVSGVVAIAAIMAAYGPLLKINSIYPVQKSL